MRYEYWMLFKVIYLSIFCIIHMKSDRNLSICNSNIQLRFLSLSVCVHNTIQMFCLHFFGLVYLYKFAYIEWMHCMFIWLKKQKWSRVTGYVSTVNCNFPLYPKHVQVHIQYSWITQNNISGVEFEGLKFDFSFWNYIENKRAPYFYVLLHHLHGVR